MTDKTPWSQHPTRGGFFRIQSPPFFIFRVPGYAISRVNETPCSSFFLIARRCNMDIEFDSKLSELLCARLCHDLIGPVTAINNGVELVTEFGDEMRGEALELIGESAKKASDLIQLYRVAFGSALGADGTGVGFDEARQQALDALASDRIIVNWPADGSGEYAGAPKTAVKLVVNMVILAVEVLPGAGEVDVRIEPGNPGRAEITARKDGFALAENFSAVFDDDPSIDDLTPRTVQAYLTRSLAGALGNGLVVDRGDGQVSFKANFTV